MDVKEMRVWQPVFLLLTPKRVENNLLPFIYTLRLKNARPGAGKRHAGGRSPSRTRPNAPLQTHHLQPDQFATCGGSGACGLLSE